MARIQPEYFTAYSSLKMARDVQREGLDEPTSVCKQCDGFRARLLC